MSPGLQDMLVDVLKRRPSLRLLVQTEPNEAHPQLRMNSHVFCAAVIPHSLVFPKLAGVIHHAGAQTVLTVLRSGVPSFPLATWGDQVVWSQRLFDLGVSVRPSHVRWLSAEILARRIDEMIADDELRTRAGQMAVLINAEDGFSEAINSMVALAGKPVL
jgi:UDP:flavonoid glycosyltransferase YjiC (YdhE family)